MVCRRANLSSMHWLSIAHGAFTQSFTVVTAYDTLGLEGLRWSLEQTKSKAAFIDSGLLSTFIQALKSAPTIEYIILNNESKPAQEHLDKLANEFPNIRVVPYDRRGEPSGTRSSRSRGPGLHHVYIRHLWYA